MSDETLKSNNNEPIKPVEDSKEVSSLKPSESPAKKPKENSVHGRPLPLVGGLALLVALAAGALAVFDYMSWQRQAPLYTSIAGDVADQAKQISTLQQTLRETTTSLQELVRQRNEDQATFNSAVQEISAKLGRTTVSWRLAEAEHLLTIANDRLSLERDRRTALIALQTADSKLQLLGDPALLPVRKQISAEVIALNAIDEPDIDGMALTLGNLTEAVSKLPLQDRAPLSEASIRKEDVEGSRSWKEILRAVWEDMKVLVRVRRHDQPVEPLLAPDEEWYLRQNLRLKLEEAQFALLRRETGLFRQSLTEAGRWLSAFFDPQAPGVANLSKTLADLSRVDLEPPLPDISDSLRRLRDQMRRLDEQVAGAGRKGGGL